MIMRPWTSILSRCLNQGSDRFGKGYEKHGSYQRLRDRFAWNGGGLVGLVCGLDHENRISRRGLDQAGEGFVQ